MNKLQKLAETKGLSVEALIEEYALDSVVLGICTNDQCDYTTNVEPDSREGWCEACDTQTVQSCLVLAGVI